VAIRDRRVRRTARRWLPRPRAASASGWWGPFRGVPPGADARSRCAGRMFSVLILLMAGSYAMLVAAGRHVPLRWDGRRDLGHAWRDRARAPRCSPRGSCNTSTTRAWATLHGLNPFTSVPGDARQRSQPTTTRLASPLQSLRPAFTLRLLTYALVPLTSSRVTGRCEMLLMAARSQPVPGVRAALLRLRGPPFRRSVRRRSPALLPRVHGLGGFPQRTS